MKFKIRNKNKAASYDVNDIEGYLTCLFFLIVYLFIAMSIISISPLKNFIDSEAPSLSGLILVGVTFLFIVILTILSLIPTYTFIYKYKEKHYPENINEKIKDCLNTPYVDKKDKEKIYLLHELIKKYGIEHSKNDQHDHFYLELDLKGNNQYNKIDYDQYDDDEKDAIQDVINHKQLTENEAIQFYNKFIDQYARPIVRSIEEKNKLKQKIVNKNI